MATDRLPIDLRLWAIVSGVLFLLLVVADAAGAIGGSLSLAAYVRDWRAGLRPGREAIEVIALRAFLFAVVAGFVGWALHGLAVIGGLRLGRLRGWHSRRDYGEPDEAEVGPDEPWEEHVGRLAALRRDGELLRRGRGSRAADPGAGPPAVPPGPAEPPAAPDPGGT